MSRPVVALCPHCAAVLELDLPIPDAGQRGVISVQLPLHWLRPSHPSTETELSVELAGSTLRAVIQPPCPWSHARLRLDAVSVGRAVDVAARRRT